MKDRIIIISLSLTVVLLYVLYKNIKSASDALPKSASISEEVKYKTDAFSLSKLNNLAENDCIFLNDGAMLIRISYDDYLNKLAENLGITYNEAKKINNNSQNSLSDGGKFSYYQYIKILSLDGTIECKYKTQLKAIIKLYVRNSYVQIENVSSINTSILNTVLLKVFRRPLQYFPPSLMGL